MIYICNAFSFAMLGHIPEDGAKHIHVRAVTQGMASRHAVRAVSRVGHQDSADRISALLGVPVPMCRESLRAESGDEILIWQYSGPRLPEGRTSLTVEEQAQCGWLLAEIG